MTLVAVLELPWGTAPMSLGICKHGRIRGPTMVPCPERGCSCPNRLGHQMHRFESPSTFTVACMHCGMIGVTRR